MYVKVSTKASNLITPMNATAVVAVAVFEYKIFGIEKAKEIREKKVS
jgi:hypothetical protein